MLSASDVAYALVPACVCQDVLYLTKADKIQPILLTPTQLHFHTVSEHIMQGGWPGGG